MTHPFLEEYVSLRREVDSSYPILVGGDILAIGAERLQTLGLPRSVVVISDSVVRPLYGARLRAALEAAGFTIALEVDFPAGEASKTRATKAELEDLMLENRIGRDAWIAALGGGVVGDMAGFTAATYLRGIPFVQFPTTLLAMVDSSVGGKTGIDTPAGKNLIGAFWQPKAVIADVATLLSLPEPEYQAGLAEVVKHAVIADARLFSFLEERWNEIQARTQAVLLELVRWNCRIKADVVEADEREGDLRKILNYGHTLGHALETAADYRLLHGTCVAIGMRWEGRVALELGLWSSADCERVEQLLTKAGFPVEGMADAASERLVELTHSDKKARAGRVEYVLPSGIGSMHRGENGYGIAVDDSTVLKVLKALRA